jgi:HD superfamily phosphohydrolase
MTLKDNIEAWVEETLQDYHPQRIRDRKAIHDAVLGTNLFYEHEIVILDTPLLQRLRMIHQTGLVYYVYPSATHTRFEHVLGVTVLSSRFIQKLNEKVSSMDISTDPKTGDLAMIRMAALLHDCGHGFLSHVSEDIYRNDPEIEALLNTDEFSICKPHEILSYYIIKSKAFRDFFTNNVNTNNVVIDLDRVADLVIGKERNPEKYYLAQIINGLFDADKLDYMVRDGYYTGLKLNIDLDRLFYTLDTKTLDNNKKELILSSSIPLEQLLFGKILLYSTVYHHQKVKACDCMVKALVEELKENGKGDNSFRFERTIDYLIITESDLFNSKSLLNQSTIMKDLSSRKLWKRAVTLCRETISNYSSSVFYKMTRLSEAKPNILRSIRERIADNVNGVSCSPQEIWIDLPIIPSLREASLAQVQLQDESIVFLEDLFPTTGWLRAYADRKWRGHIFGPADKQEQIFRAAKIVLESEFGFQLNEKKNKAFCHF